MCVTSRPLGLVTSRLAAPENQVRSPSSQAGSSFSAQPMMTSSKAARSRFRSSQLSYMLSELGIPSAFGRGVPAKRLIQIWSPHTRWLSVPWMEPKKAPR